MVYQVTQLYYEYNDCALKLYPDIATVTTRSCYFWPHSPLIFVKIACCRQLHKNLPYHLLDPVSLVSHTT